MSKSIKRLKVLRARSYGSSLVKIKTKKSAYKRYKVLGSGKVKVCRAFRGHNTGARSASRMNRLSKAGVISKANVLLVKRCLPNSF